MKRPVHGFKRVANNLSAKYICTCGADNCWQADEDWGDWAQAEIERLRALLVRCRDSLEESLDDVHAAYVSDWRHGMPTRADQLQGYKDSLDRHVELIDELQQEQGE